MDKGRWDALIKQVRMTERDGGDDLGTNFDCVCYECMWVGFYFLFLCAHMYLQCFLCGYVLVPVCVCVCGYIVARGRRFSVSAPAG